MSVTWVAFDLCLTDTLIMLYRYFTDTKIYFTYPYVMHICIYILYIYICITICENIYKGLMNSFQLLSLYHFLRDVYLKKNNIKYPLVLFCFYSPHSSED